ncbi:MAG: hypothetical protein ABR508_08775 [Candidatus Baltobacteraceae bacterium]
MRMTLLGLIFFLALTLLNAVAFRQNADFVNAHDFAPLQLTKAGSSHYEWDIFLAREVAAIAATALLFGAIAGARSTRVRRRKAHPQFARHIANRRR